MQPSSRRPAPAEGEGDAEPAKGNTMGFDPTAPEYDLSEIREKLSTRSGRQFWRSLEEVAETEEFREFLHAEFPAAVDSLTSSLDRRQFLKLMGASLALAARDVVLLGEVQAECRARGLWVNVADEPEHCDFYMTSVVVRGELTVGVSKTRQQVRLALLVAAVAFAVLALARPQWGFAWEEVSQKGLDIVVAIDTSRSMLATDIPPNRLERAKLAAAPLFDHQRAYQVGRFDDSDMIPSTMPGSVNKQTGTPDVSSVTLGAEGKPTAGGRQNETARTMQTPREIHLEKLSRLCLKHTPHKGETMTLGLMRLENVLTFCSGERTLVRALNDHAMEVFDGDGAWTTIVMTRVSVPTDGHDLTHWLRQARHGAWITMLGEHGDRCLLAHRGSSPNIRTTNICAHCSEAGPFRWIPRDATLSMHPWPGDGQGVVLMLLRHSDSDQCDATLAQTLATWHFSVQTSEQA